MSVRNEVQIMSGMYACVRPLARFSGPMARNISDLLQDTKHYAAVCRIFQALKGLQVTKSFTPFPSQPSEHQQCGYPSVAAEQQHHLLLWSTRPIQPNPTTARHHAGPLLAIGRAKGASTCIFVPKGRPSACCSSRLLRIHGFSLLIDMSALRHYWYRLWKPSQRIRKT